MSDAVNGIMWKRVNLHVRQAFGVYKTRADDVTIHLHLWLCYNGVGRISPPLVSSVCATKHTPHL